MQKAVGSSPIIRFKKKPRRSGAYCCGMPTKGGTL
jgi:hypothetical protein